MKHSFIKRSFILFFTLGAFVPAFIPASAATPLGSDTVAYPVDAASVVLTDGYSASHTAVDLAPRHKGETLTVVSAADGEVLVAGDCTKDPNNRWCASFGNTVVVKHASGYRTLYGHLGRVDVKVGDKVNQGQTLGVVGETGHVVKPFDYTGGVLHFAVCKTFCSRTNLNDTMNPLTLFPNYANHVAAAVSTSVSVQDGG